MNLSMLPLYAISRLADCLRGLAKGIEERADRLEANSRMSSTHRAILQRNAVFADKHKGRRAFVIVNGPSLATQNISVLQNEITFCVSGFWKHEAITYWQPTYYSLLDANFFVDTGPTRDFYYNLNSRVRQSTFFLPLFRGYDAIARHNFLPSAQCFYVASIGTRGPASDLTSIVQGFAGVSAFALAQAIFMGCSPIYLLGFDHDYLANRGVDKHFYRGGTIPGHPATDMPLSDRIPYDQEMRANLRLWGNYRRLKIEAERKGIEIFNATAGGYLDVFDRIDYSQVCSLVEDSGSAIVL